MTVADKLRFLADRVDDGKEFYMTDLYMKSVPMKFNSYNILTKKIDGKWDYSSVEFNHLIYHEFKHKPRWEFTGDEEAILKNLPAEYRWIARDKDDNGLYIYTSEPTRASQHWVYDTGEMKYIDIFNHLFQSIQWSDDEPCEFRKYL